MRTHSARSRVRGVLGVLAAVAVVAGVHVLYNSGGAVGESPAPPAAAASVPPPHAGAESGPVATAAEHHGADQPPGTVRLPSGATVALIRQELTPDGTLPIPDGLDEASWWGAELGADRGAALLSGHVNWGGQVGSFAELWGDLRGQEVTVRDTGGTRWVYRITDAVTLHKDDLPRHAERLFAQDGPHRLVLVTCGGVYAGGTDGYRDNRILTGKLITRS